MFNSNEKLENFKLSVNFYDKKVLTASDLDDAFREIYEFLDKQDTDITFVDYKIESELTKLGKNTNGFVVSDGNGGFTIEEAVDMEIPLETYDNFNFENIDFSKLKGTGILFVNSEGQLGVKEINKNCAFYSVCKEIGKGEIKILDFNFAKKEIEFEFKNCKLNYSSLSDKLKLEIEEKIKNELENETGEATVNIIGEIPDLGELYCRTNIFKIVSDGNFNDKFSNEYLNDNLKFKNMVRQFYRGSVTIENLQNNCVLRSELIGHISTTDKNKNHKVFYSNVIGHIRNTMPLTTNVIPNMSNSLNDISYIRYIPNAVPNGKSEFCKSSNLNLQIFETNDRRGYVDYHAEGCIDESFFDSKFHTLFLGL